ncbi:MAG: M14 family zinc carboxypeptidase [Pseudomonadota bacterium]
MAGLKPTLGAALVLLAAASSAQTLVEWTEEDGQLGLGYPVPIPVDTPLPFDGFRTYAGLVARHQQLEMDHEALAGTVVGASRNGREIRAYRMSDPDDLTLLGLPEPGLMIQGTIHAREWQSPEVVTGLMEWLLERGDDRGFHQYLLENTNIVVIPVVNVDGFLQTQRFPTLNYLGQDPVAPNSFPRDGRMTRKNLRDRDEDIDTTDDHLLGVDLNRNNPPFWATSANSSPDERSLVYHGTEPHGEPETQAMAAAVGLVPAERMRLYTDVHSFGRLFFSERVVNNRRNVITANIIADFSNHHVTLPGNKRYVNDPSPIKFSTGFGSTDEYFSETFDVPSWTLEIEPAGGGEEYGGFGRNSSDGFILPDAEIRRVRENLAQSQLVAFYHQAGPPTIVAARVTDVATGATVQDFEWDVVDPANRALHHTSVRPLVAGREYDLWLAFDKPMRWREGGEVVPLPGQSEIGLRVISDLRIDGQPLTETVLAEDWLETIGGAPDGYFSYRDDAYRKRFRLEEGGTGEATFFLQAADLVGQRTDGQPATVVDWRGGNWIGYENLDGEEGDVGGTDATLTVPVDGEATPAFLVEPGSTAAYFDPTHDGEGFLIEIVDAALAVVYWFTYDENGAQRWYTGNGEIRGNEIVVEDLLGVAGGRFGDAFDPDAIERFRVGRLSLLFTGCDGAQLRFGTPGKVFRQDLVRLSEVSGLGCGSGITPDNAAFATGSWFDPARSGEGFVVQALADGRGLVYWFTFDTEGQPAWYFGTGDLTDSGVVTIEDAFVTSGGRFGDDFDPDDVVLERWGTLRFRFGCTGGSMSYDDTPPGFGAGSFDIAALTRPAGAETCPSR